MRTKAESGKVGKWESGSGRLLLLTCALFLTCGLLTTMAATGPSGGGSSGSATNAQPPSATLTNLSNNPYKAYTNIAPSRIIVYEGDSLVEQALPVWPDFMETNSFWFARSSVATNWGADGDTVQNIAATYATQAHLNRPTNNTDEAFFLLHAGFNDYTAGRTDAQLYADMKTVWAAARADRYKVVAMPIVGHTNLAALMVSDLSLFDYLVRVDVVLSNTNGTNCYYDTVHPTIFGANVIAKAVAAAVDSKPWMVVNSKEETNATAMVMDLLLNPGGRNVGINAPMPLATLHIRSTHSGTDSLRIDDTNGSPRFQFGVYPGGSQYATLWAANVTPNGTNYLTASDGSTTVINGPDFLSLNVGHSVKGYLDAGGLNMGTPIRPTSSNAVSLGSFNLPWNTNWVNAIVANGPIVITSTGTNQLGPTAFTNLSAGLLALDANLTAYSTSGSQFLTNSQSTPVSLLGGFTNGTTLVVTQAVGGGAVVVGRYVGAPASYENGWSNVYSGTAADQIMDLWLRQNGSLVVPLRLRGDGLSEISSNLVVGSRLGSGGVPRGTLHLRAPSDPSLYFGNTVDANFTNHIVSHLDGAVASNNLVSIGVTDQTGITVGNTLKLRGNGITEISGTVQVNGTTNQIRFGSTNVAPSVALAPVKWISVSVGGETNAYRIPLFE